MPLLTQKAYAKHRRVTPQYINRCVRDGVIVLVKGKVDQTKADRALGARHQTKPRRRSVGSGQRVTGNASGRPSRGTATSSLTEGRAKKVHYEALQAELSYKLQTGLLLPKAEVLEAERRKNANIRTRFRRLARGLAPLMARTTNAAEAEAILLAEIDAQLSELAADPLGEVSPAVPPTPESVAPPAPAAGLVQTSARPADRIWA